MLVDQLTWRWSGAAAFREPLTPAGLAHRGLSKRSRVSAVLLERLAPGAKGPALGRGHRRPATRKRGNSGTPGPQRTASISGSGIRSPGIGRTVGES